VIIFASVVYKAALCLNAEGCFFLYPMDDGREDEGRQARHLSSIVFLLLLAKQACSRYDGADGSKIAKGQSKADSGCGEQEGL
jgi:hypothetical protein